MYQRFKDCLLKPRNIANYVKEPKKHTIIYTTILLILYVLPLVLIVVLSNAPAVNLSSNFSELLIETEQINYEIKDGKLQKTKEDAPVQYVKAQIEVYHPYYLNTLYVFDVTDSDYLLINDVDPGTYVVLLFTETEFKITTLKVEKPVDNNNGATLVNVTANNKEYKKNSIISYTYEELKIKDINFSGNKDNNLTDFKNDMAVIISAIYNKAKVMLLPGIILSVILIGVGNYFLSVLVVAALYKLLYRYLEVNFKVVFKAAILCSTPYVICSLLVMVTNFTILTVLGQLIMVIYVNRAVTVYKIKFDGGVPLPKFIQNMMGDKKEEEKGSDDDEL